MSGYEVHIRYSFYSPEMDSVAHMAAGRPSTHSGLDCSGDRDLGWKCSSELDAHRVARGLERAGFCTVLVSGVGA